MRTRNSNHICHTARRRVRVSIAVSTSPKIHARVRRVAGWRTCCHMLASAQAHIGGTVACAVCHRAAVDIDTRAGSQAWFGMAFPTRAETGMRARSRISTRHGPDIWRATVHRALGPIWEQM